VGRVRWAYRRQKKLTEASILQSLRMQGEAHEGCCEYVTRRRKSKGGLGSSTGEVKTGRSFNDVFKKAEIFSFDGENLTVKQIHAKVPALSLQTVRNHLKCGRLTSIAMLTFSTEAVRTANGKRAAKRYKARTS